MLPSPSKFQTAAWRPGIGASSGPWEHLVWRVCSGHIGCCKMIFAKGYTTITPRVCRRQYRAEFVSPTVSPILNPLWQEGGEKHWNWRHRDLEAFFMRGFLKIKGFWVSVISGIYRHNIRAAMYAYTCILYTYSDSLWSLADVKLVKKNEAASWRASLCWYVCSVYLWRLEIPQR